MLLALLAALAVAMPTVVTKGELAPGPLLSWSDVGAEEHVVRVRPVYEPGAKALTLVKSSLPLLVVGRDGRNGVLVAETGDEFTVWRVDAVGGKVEPWTGETPPAPSKEARTQCGDRWPPRAAGTWSIYAGEPIEGRKTIASAKSFGFDSNRAKTYAEGGGPVMHKVAGLVGSLGDEDLVAFAGEDEILWAVGKDGVARKAATLDDEDVGLVSSVTVSPDGSKFAVGAVPRDQWNLRTLVVFDAMTAERLFEKRDIDVTTTVQRSLPVLEVVWMGEEKLRYSQTTPEGMQFVELGLGDGEQTWTQHYTSVMSDKHRVPPGEGCLAVSVENGQVRVSDSGALVLAGAFTAADCHWSVDGRMAACFEKDNMWLVDGDSGKAKMVYNKPSQGLKWLP